MKRSLFPKKLNNPSLLVKQVLKIASVLARPDLGSLPNVSNSLQNFFSFKSESANPLTVVFISSIELGGTLANSLIATLQNQLFQWGEIRTLCKPCRTIHMATNNSLAKLLLQPGSGSKSCVQDSVAPSC